MTESLPTNRTVLADIPEVEMFEAKFKYNFFQPDERINDTGRATREFILEKPTESFDAKFIQSDQFNRFTSRYISLSWRPVANNHNFKPEGFKIADNFDKIHEEHHFIGDAYSSVYFQDTGADEKVSYYVKTLNDQVAGTDPNQRFSGLDQAKNILFKTGGKVGNDKVDNPGIYMDSLNRPESQGFVFFQDGEKIQNPSILDEIKDNKFFLHFNNKVIADAFASVAERSFSVFQDEVDEFIGSLKNSQAATTAKMPGNVLDAKDYELEIEEFVGYRPLGTTAYEPRQEYVGYLIEKVEIDIDGNISVKEPIFIENPNVNTTVDVKIKYGSTYKYTIRTIALFETVAESESSTQGTLLVQYLIASKPTAEKIVVCEEQIPPPPPSDFKPRWDGIKNALCLEWNFPVNTQRDIKGWQIFRRSSLDEPFELQKFYSFDDSVIKVKGNRAEDVDTALTETLTSPKNIYLDGAFTKDSKYIYAICSVDARGLSSNYSTQFEVTFDRFRNKLVYKMVSRSGAPKAYPNWFLNEDSFVDTIRDSGHTRCKIVFNPEFMDVFDSQNNNLGLIKTKENSTYVLSMINTDLQTQKNIEIKIKDRRQSADKNRNMIKERRLLQNRRDMFDRFVKFKSK